jgi:hypothetical protein
VSRPPPNTTPQLKQFAPVTNRSGSHDLAGLPRTLSRSFRDENRGILDAALYLLDVKYFVDLFISFTLPFLARLTRSRRPTPQARRPCL